jgi:hypothetical protein
VHSNSGDLSVRDLALARMQPGSHGQAKFAQAFDDRRRAADRARRTVEGREEAVARAVDFPAAISQQLAAHEGIVERVTRLRSH